MKPEDNCTNPRPLPIGSTIGILGGGQLGMMLALEERRIGYRTAALDPDPIAPAMKAVDEAVVAEYDDEEALHRMRTFCDVFTYEFENIPSESAAFVERLSLLLPSSKVLNITQHRLKEKEAIRAAGAPIVPFASVSNVKSLEAGLAEIGTPAILKSVTSGYDGKGQLVIDDPSFSSDNFQSLKMSEKEGENGFILEQKIDLEKEISVIVARDGSCEKPRRVIFPIAENVHTNGILDWTVAPARISDSLAEKAREIASLLADTLDVTGLLTVEMFVAKNGRLFVNELAPRPHNSGHFTIDACRTSQFGQLARILAGLPLGAVTQPRPAAMVNLLGDVWLETEGNPDWDGALSFPCVSLHTYGKSKPREGRKMGHLTVVADTVSAAEYVALTAREIARRKISPLDAQTNRKYVPVTESFPNF